MKKVLLLLLVLIAAIIVVAVRPVSAGVELVNICHVPPGNPDNVQLITVGAPAVPAHLSHGDFFPEEGCRGPQ